MGDQYVAPAQVMVKEAGIVDAADAIGDLRGDGIAELAELPARAVGAVGFQILLKWQGIGDRFGEDNCFAQAADEVTDLAAGDPACAADAEALEDLVAFDFASSFGPPAEESP